MNIVYKEKVGLVETSIAMENVNFKDFSSNTKMTNTIRSMIEAIKDKEDNIEHDEKYLQECMDLLATREDNKLKRTGLQDKSCGAGELIPEGEL